MSLSAERIRVLFWDIDGTVLNFEASERAAIRKGFAAMGLGECTEEMLRDYSAINLRYWKRLERGELTKPEILTLRFREFFGKYGLDTGCVEAFNAQYPLDLGDTICFNDDALALLSALKGRYRQYAVTNGTAAAQHRKLERSGLKCILDGWFISDELGAEKPSPIFFDRALEYVRQQIGPLERNEILLIGDSLTSDMLGGERAGLPTCWYNPRGEANTSGVRTDWVIGDLNELSALLGLN